VGSGNENDKITHRQLMALTFIGLFSPVIRLLPKTSVQLAGSAAWLTPVAAAVPLTLYLWFMRAFVKNRGENEGLAHLFERCIGRGPGKVLSSIFGLWLIFYAGFQLRTGGERLLSSIYANGSVAFFMGIMIVLAVIVAMGSVRSMTRAAEVFVLVILGVLVLVFIFAVTDINPQNLLPVSYLNAGRVLVGALPLIDVLSVSAYYMFLQGHVDKKTESFSGMVRWQSLLLVITMAVMVTSIGMLSSTVIANLQNPFFIMIRDITIFGIVERIESVVITLWVITDLCLLSALITICSEVFESVTGRKRKKLVAAVVGAAVFACGMLVSRDAFGLIIFSERIVPGVHMLLVFIVLPAVFIAGKIRKKI